MRRAPRDPSELGGSVSRRMRRADRARGGRARPRRGVGRGVGRGTGRGVGRGNRRGNRRGVGRGNRRGNRCGVGRGNRCGVGRGNRRGNRRGNGRGAPSHRLRGRRARRLPRPRPLPGRGGVRGWLGSPGDVGRWSDVRSARGERRGAPEWPRLLGRRPLRGGLPRVFERGRARRALSGRMLGISRRVVSVLRDPAERPGLRSLRDGDDDGLYGRRLPRGVRAERGDRQRRLRVRHARLDDAARPGHLRPARSLQQQPLRNAAVAMGVRIRGHPRGRQRDQARLGERRRGLLPRLSATAAQASVELSASGAARRSTPRGRPGARAGS